MSFDTPLPASQQPRSGDVLHSVLRVTTSSGVQVYKVGDVVKLDTKPIIYGKVMHFVKVSKKNDVDKVVVQRQPDEVGEHDETNDVSVLIYTSKEPTSWPSFVLSRIALSPALCDDISNATTYTTDEIVFAILCNRFTGI